ncbi:bifunctional folylpolyglutamate synthase/dihydrofolate synthase [Endomicrobiia bacterium]|nr:bifunctional folylpolyglutamate synthase/dihydrofolate synthase [Endomicrobiia bacterium]
MNFLKKSKEYEGMTPGLSRVKKFFETIGNPQDKIKAIHVAGTNGKGSTVVFISKILQEGKYKTALYTSPHLVSVTERIKINGKNIPLKIFDNLSEKYLGKAVKYKLSYFEYLTALAFIYFAEQKVDIAVLETGLGGRLDATNIIKKPLVCVITSIAKEHQEVLGDTIRQITYEKAGIIKKGAYVVCGKLPKEAVSVIKNKLKNPYLYGKDFKAFNDKACNLNQRFNYISANKKVKSVEIKLLGRHQIVNATVAICVAELLNKKKYSLNETSIRTGLRDAVWPGRFDIRKVIINNKKIEIIIDGAHNIESLNAFVETFKQLGFAKKQRVFIFGTMKEKKYKYMIKKIVPFAKKIILPYIKNDRAVNPEVLKAEFSKNIACSRIYVVDSVKSACDMMEDGETAVSVGSLYLAGEVLTELYSNM